MQALFTASDFARLPEGFPAQLIEGCLVKDTAPTYGHQRIQSRLHAILVRSVHPDLALTAPVDVVLGEHDVYQPDLVVLRKAPPRTQSDVGIPLLAIEVLSPSTRRRDREVKTKHLLAAGVAEVWLVDPDGEVVELHTLGGVRIARGQASLASRVVPGFTVVPDELFR